MQIPLWRRKWIDAGGNPAASYEAGYGVGNAISGHDPEAISFSFYSHFDERGASLCTSLETDSMNAFAYFAKMLISAIPATPFMEVTVVKARKILSAIGTFVIVGAASTAGAALWTNVLDGKFQMAKVKLTHPKSDKIIFVDFRKAGRGR